MNPSEEEIKKKEEGAGASPVEKEGEAPAEAEEAPVDPETVAAE